MVIAFKEKDRLVIEANEMSIIEFKRWLYKLYEITSNAYEIVKDAIDNIEKVWEVFKTRFLEAIGNVNFMVEQIMEAYNYPTYPTMRRYRVAKVLSKCTGIEKRELWKMTRRTWLAMSCC